MYICDQGDSLKRADVHTSHCALVRGISCVLNPAIPHACIWHLRRVTPDTHLQQRLPTMQQEFLPLSRSYCLQDRRNTLKAAQTCALTAHVMHLNTFHTALHIPHPTARFSSWGRSAGVTAKGQDVYPLLALSLSCLVMPSTAVGSRASVQLGGTTKGLSLTRCSPAMRTCNAYGCRCLACWTCLEVSGRLIKITAVRLSRWS